MPLSSPMITSRRHALGLPLLSLAGAPVARPRKARGKKKRKNRCGRKIERAVAETCGQQFDPCMTSASELCSRAIDPAACQAQLRECCGFMGRCEPEAYLACVTALVSTLPTP